MINLGSVGAGLPANGVDAALNPSRASPLLQLANGVDAALNPSRASPLLQ